MIARTIRERLQREPFEPFVIRSSSGEAVRVASPELAVLMKTGIFVAATNSDRWAQPAVPPHRRAGKRRERERSPEAVAAPVTSTDSRFARCNQRAATVRERTGR
jgi:hypothetical protein